MSHPHPGPKIPPPPPRPTTCCSRGETYLARIGGVGGESERIMRPFSLLHMLSAISIDSSAVKSEYGKNESSSSTKECNFPSILFLHILIFHLHRTAFSSSSPSCAFFNPFHYSFSFSYRSEEFFQHALKSRVGCILQFQLEELD